MTLLGIGVGSVGTGYDGKGPSKGKQQLCSFAFDFDDWDAVEAWFGCWENVLAWSNKTRIEWHEDKRKVHMLFLAYRPVANRKIKIKNAFLEVRCEEQLLFVHPSIHPDGNTWKPLGTEQIALLVVCSIISKSVYTSLVRRLDTRRTEIYYLVISKIVII
jgi:hypothetical protein